MFNIYLDGSHKGFRPVQCQNCNNNTGTIVLEDLKFYGRFLCDLCAENFTYSSFDQCVAVQKVLEQAYISEYCDNDTLMHLNFGEGVIKYYNYQNIESLPIPPIIKIVLKVGINLFLSEVRNNINAENTRKQRETAKEASYDIRPFFNELPNHFIDT